MHQSLARPDAPVGAELRAHTRTHLFVVATLNTETLRMAVTIRNLSALGALIEAPVLPPAGTMVLIRRASLSVEGRVAWKSKNQAGIAFSSHIVVPAWLPRQPGSRQSVIDQIVLDSRNGSGVMAEPSREDSTLPAPYSALAELTSLRIDLVNLGDALVRDIALIAKHPEIQLIDIAVQRIDRIMSHVTTDRMAHD